MAKRILELLVDDLDGTVLESGGETITFGLDGKSYEIDLSTDHANALRAALSPYLTAGRTTSGRRRSRMANNTRPVKSHA